MAGTTRVELQGNVAATSFGGAIGAGYLTDPDSLHLSIVTIDAYSGISTLEGQPRPCASILCLNKNVFSGVRGDASWGPVGLKPPEGMGNASFGNLLNLRAATYVDGRVPYRYPAPNSNTFASDLITNIGGTAPRLNFGGFKAPGYGTNFMLGGN